MGQTTSTTYYPHTTHILPTYYPHTTHILPTYLPTYLLTSLPSAALASEHDLHEWKPASISVGLEKTLMQASSKLDLRELIHLRRNPDTSYHAHDASNSFLAGMPLQKCSGQYLLGGKGFTLQRSKKHPTQILETFI